MFAPLKLAGKGSTERLPRLKGVVFDMRRALGISKPTDILDHIESLPPHEQTVAEEAIRDIERKAMGEMTASPGLVPLMEYLASRGIKKSICTRNFDGPTQHLVSTFLGSIDVSPIVTRTFKPPKPHPAGILRIAEEWGTQPSEMLMIGDSIDDMLAGRAAGAKTVLLRAREGHNEYLIGHEATDAWVDRLDDLIPLLEEGRLIATIPSHH